MLQWEKNLYISWITQILSLTGFIMPFMPLYIQQLGVSAESKLRLWVGMLNAVPSLAMGVMAPIWGILSDRLGRKVMILRAMIFGTIIIGCMALARNVHRYSSSGLPKVCLPAPSPPRQPWLLLEHLGRKCPRHLCFSLPQHLSGFPLDRLSVGWQ